MPKTDIKKIESEDVAELSDETLDRTADVQACFCQACMLTGNCSSPAE
ncbi:MAG: hypothetical protein ISR48_03105 [Alphaproteobacteria bacterium]|nr:hypothetical protein [Alphaproteobacteria bacterium]